MINVLSSMLSQAGGDSPTKRAVIAADQVFDHSWEALEEQWKQPGVGAPATYQDYVLQKQAYFDKNNLTSVPGQTVQNGQEARKWVKPMRPPATKTVRVLKAGVAIGAPLVAMYGWDQRANISAGVASIVGVNDSTGAVCGNSKYLSDNGVPSGLTGFQNWVTGQDCSAWQFAQDYVPNIDFSQRPAGWQAYPINWGTYNASYSGGYYAVFTTGTALSGGRSGSFTLTDLYGGVRPQTIGPYYTTCRADTGGAITAGPNMSGSASYSTTDPNTITYDCGSGKQLYSVDLSGQTPGVTAPDTLSAGILKYMWFSAQSPKYVAGVGGDPDRTLTCTITGTNGQTYQATSPTFKEGSGVSPEPNCPTMPDDVGATNVGVVENGGGVTKQLLNEPTTPAYQAWWTAYPECREGACALDLSRKSDGKSCFADTATAASCADWLKDPLRSTNYQCTYGVHNVDITECFAYGDVFKPDKVLTGQPYTDPSTGLAVTGQSSPGAANSALNRTIVDPRDFNGCLDKGWAAANPVEWVMTPVNCSMQASFIPRTGFVDGQLTKVALTWSNTGPAKLAASVGAWHIAPNVAGCSSTMNFPVPMIGKTIAVPVIQACPGTPFGDFAPFIRTLVTAVLIVTAGFACKRIVSGWVA